MYMRQNIVSHFMSLCRFRRKIGLKLGAKTGRSDTFYPKRQHLVALDYDRNATAVSFWIILWRFGWNKHVAIAKLSLRPSFAPNEMRRSGHLWNRNQYISRTYMNDKMGSTHQI